MKTRAGAFALAVLSCAFGACESPRHRDWLEGSALGETWAAPDGSYFVTQLPNADVVALSAQDGALLWRYQHVGSPEHRIIEFPRARLVCSPRFGGADHVFLLFSDLLVDVSAEHGRARFRLPIRNAPARNACPVATPDSGIVLLVQRGRGVAKIAATGLMVWSFQFPDGAVARSGPTVVPSSGDIIVRAGANLLNVSPAGELNWSRPL